MSEDVKEQAARHGRTIKTIINPHMLCRDSEAEARAVRQAIIDQGDPVAAQNFLRSLVGGGSQSWQRRTLDEIYVGGNLQVVGTPEQVVEQIVNLHCVGCDGIQVNFFDYLPDIGRFAEKILQHRSRAAAGPDVVHCLAAARAQTSFLTPRVLQQQRLATGERVVLSDIRSAGDFATAHIPGARWLSRGRLDLQIAQEAPHKDSVVVLYCRKGNEATLSAPTLNTLGYHRVSVLDGGFEAWKRAKFPTEQGLGAQAEFEELASAEVGLLGSGPYGYSNERMARYLKEEEELGAKYQRKTERPQA